MYSDAAWAGYGPVHSALLGDVGPPQAAIASVPARQSLCGVRIAFDVGLQCVRPTAERSAARRSRRTVAGPQTERSHKHWTLALWRLLDPRQLSVAQRRLPIPIDPRRHTALYFLKMALGIIA